MKISLLIFSSLVLIVGASNSLDENELKKDTKIMDSHLEVATFAGGCFWCIESSFEHLEGVMRAVSGYTGGSLENPTYEQVSSGDTGHVEAVQVFFNPKLISYSSLLEHFWRQFDPTDVSGSFVDRGEQYTSAIFYHSEIQKRLAEESRLRLDQSEIFEKPVATKILATSQFYTAEDYHQDYYKKNPIRYKLYRTASGRDKFIDKIWEGKKNGAHAIVSVEPFKKEKENLSPLQFDVTQKNSTEPPFQNEYWNNKEEGIYVDIVSGEPLFSSIDKFDSGTGWPSFSKTINPQNFVEHEESSLFMKRVEIKSKKGESHLGHVFNDGPSPTGLRYCINSASMRFIPKAKLDTEGYGKFKELFQ